MHVAIEAVGIKQGGGVVVLNGILRALVADPRFDRITVFASPEDRLDGPRQEGEGIIWRTMTLEDRTYAGRLAWLQRGLAHATNRLGADVVLCMNGVGASDVPSVNYVQQALYFDGSARATLTAAQRLKYRTLAAMAERSCHNAEFVIVQTSWMQKQVKSQWDIWSTVAPPAPPKRQAPLEMQKHVLWVGSDLAYKNKQDAVRASFELSERGVGMVYAETGESAETRRELARMMRSSVALAMTSLTESYALPLVEAMAWSCPIVVVDRPYAKDVCDAAAIYYEPGDVSALSSALLELATDEGLRSSLISRGWKRSDHLRDLQGEEQICDLLVEATE